MNRSFSVGDTVRLTENMRRACASPDRYERMQIGTVTRVGDYNVYDVLWNGYVNPIGMRGDELEMAEQRSFTYDDVVFLASGAELCAEYERDHDVVFDDDEQLAQFLIGCKKIYDERSKTEEPYWLDIVSEQLEDFFSIV